MKLSIITVNYNNREGLRKTIESVIHQTWTDYEYIIIDGGSTDGSRELIEQYQDLLAYWCSEPDKGIYNAMNKGVQHAHGEYVNFMNSGDCFYENDTLDKVFREGLAADILSGQVESLQYGTLIHKYEKNVLMQLYLDTLNHQGSFIRRQLLLRRPYDETLQIVSDWKFWLETVLYDGARVAYSKIIVARMDSTGISTNTDILVKERKACLEQLPLPLLQILDDYQWLRTWIEVERLSFLKQKWPLVYWMCHYVITFASRLSTLFTRKSPS